MVFPKFCIAKCWLSQNLVLFRILVTVNIWLKSKFGLVIGMDETDESEVHVWDFNQNFKY